LAPEQSGLEPFRTPERMTKLLVGVENVATLTYFAWNDLLLKVSTFHFMRIHVHFLCAQCSATFLKLNWIVIGTMSFNGCMNGPF